MLALEAIREALGSAPLAVPPCSSHGPPRLHGLFDMMGCLHHQIEDGLVCAHHTEPLEGGPRIDASHKRLISGLLFVAQLHVEQAQFVALGLGLSTPQQVACFGGSTRHEGYPTRINYGYSQGISLLQVRAWVI